MSAEARRQLGRMGAAGVTLSAPQAPFAWQAWRFQYLHRCLRKFGDELGLIDALHLFVAGVTLSALRARFVWCVCNFMYVCMSTVLHSIASFPTSQATQTLQVKDLVKLGLLS